MSFLNGPVFEIKLLTKLQFSDNILFKLFSRNISEDLANLTDVNHVVMLLLQCIEMFVLYAFLLIKFYFGSPYVTLL